MNKELSMALSIICLLILAMGCVGNVDYVDQRNSDELYCERVRAWEEDKAAGVGEYDRTGWPDYRGTFDQLCMSNAERIDAARGKDNE